MRAVTADPELSAQEVRRVAAKGPLWRALCDTGTVLNVHIGSSGRLAGHPGRGRRGPAGGPARADHRGHLLSHSQLTERDRWAEVGSPAGPVTALLPPPESDGWDWRLDPVPVLGEHTEPVLRELGFSDEDLAVLRAEAVIGPGAGAGEGPRPDAGGQPG